MALSEDLPAEIRAASIRISVCRVSGSPMDPSWYAMWVWMYGMVWSDTGTSKTDDCGQEMFGNIGQNSMWVQAGCLVGMPTIVTRK